MNLNLGVLIDEEKSSLNDPGWYKEIDILKIDRISILSIVGSIELTLRYPGIKLSLRKTLNHLGKHLALRLLAEGLMLPKDVMDSWRHTFQI